VISDIKVDLIIYLSSDKNPILQIWRDRLLFLFFSGICRFVYIKSDKTTFYGRLRRSSRTYINEVLRLVGGLKKIGIKCNSISFDLPITQIKMKKVTVLLQDKFINNKSILIGMCPWTKQQAKRWPFERYAELGKKLIDNYNVNIVIVGGKDEAIIGKEVSKAWPDSRWIVLAGELDVLETAELLKRCAFYIGNDTGAMHIAAAVGTPCIAIFSAKDAAESWYPFGENHIVLRKNVPCRNCYLNECYRNKLVCLTKISLDEVFEKCKLIISKIQEEK
jgi:ADP-heptose:LPS heptosyltransferase